MTSQLDFSIHSERRDKNHRLNIEKQRFDLLSFPDSGSQNVKTRLGFFQRSIRRSDLFDTHMHPY